MKQLRKRLLTLLALTLFGGAGAWAQGPTAAEINADVYSGWSSIDNVLLKASELPGFQAVTEDQAKSWTGVPSTGKVRLYYEFVADGHVKYVRFENGVYDGSNESNDLERYEIYEDIVYDGSRKYFYTTGGGAIELTKAGANQWTLGQTPDYDLELQVEYYQPHTLDSIPLDWQVKVGNAAPVYPTAYTEGNTTLGYLTITETDSVELIPPADVKPNVKNVELVEPVAVQTVNIGNVTLQVVEGETWRQIAQRNPGVITADDEDNGYVYRDLDTVLRVGTDYIFPTDTYNSSLSDQYYWYEY